MSNTVKTSKLFDAISAIIAGGGKPCLVGPSGCGKTQIVAQYAASIGAELVPVHLMSMSPEDAKFPIVDPVLGTVTFVPAHMFLANGNVKLFFWDELTHAATMLQSMCYQVFEGNRLGDFMLPPDCLHIAAHNRVSDKGVHNRVPDPLRRRWFELAVEPDLQAWVDWANRNGVDPLVINYVRWKPDHFYMDIEKGGMAPDPRAWVKISDLMKANPTIDPDLLHALVCGKVGDGVASEFTAFLRLYAGLPDLNAIISNPKSHVAGVTETDARKVNPALAYAVSAGLGRLATVSNFGKVLAFLERMPEDFNVLSVRDATTRDKALTATPDMVRWSIKHQDVIL